MYSTNYIGTRLFRLAPGEFFDIRILLGVRFHLLQNGVFLETS